MAAKMPVNQNSWRKSGFQACLQMAYLCTRLVAPSSTKADRQNDRYQIITLALSKYHGADVNLRNYNSAHDVAPH